DWHRLVDVSGTQTRSRVSRPGNDRAFPSRPSAPISLTSNYTRPLSIRASQMCFRLLLCRAYGGSSSSRSWLAFGPVVRPRPWRLPRSHRKASIQNSEQTRGGGLSESGPGSHTGNRRGLRVAGLRSAGAVGGVGFVVARRTPAHLPSSLHAA